MGEGGSHFESFEQRRSALSERDPNAELREHLELFNKLLARLVEQGGDISVQVKKSLRGQIQGLLQLIGVKSLDDYEGFAKIYERLSNSVFGLPPSKDYPNDGEINRILMKIYGEGKSKPLPILGTPKAADVAVHGRCDWKEIEGRGGMGIANYIGGLGRVMSSEYAYTTIFGENDAITVGEGWNIENGRHRALALRVLGEDYVERKGMNRWVEVRKE